MFPTRTWASWRHESYYSCFLQHSTPRHHFWWFTLNIYKLVNKKEKGRKIRIFKREERKTIHLGISKKSFIFRKKNWFPHQAGYIFPLYHNKETILFSEKLTFIWKDTTCPTLIFQGLYTIACLTIVPMPKCLTANYTTA